jgi:hypothetical protein
VKRKGGGIKDGEKNRGKRKERKIKNGRSI